MRAVVDQSLILLEQVIGRAVFLDDDDHMLNLRDVVGLGVGKRCRERNQEQQVSGANFMEQPPHH